MRILALFLLSIMALLLVACQQEGGRVTHDEGGITVVVSNFPMYHLATSLAPESVSVIFPVPRDVDPAFWEPTPEDIQVMQTADLVVLNGASYEKWREWVSLPEARVVETAASFREQWIISGDATVHSHGPTGAHSHGEVDFNTWLDPQLASLQAEATAGALRQFLPDDAATIEQNLARLKSELEHLDKLFKSIAVEIGDAPIIASHPVYDYIGRQYGLNLRSVHWEPDLAPTAEGWQEFDQLLDSHPARVMLWEDDPIDETAAKLRERGINPVVFRTAGNASQEADLIQIMQANGERLKNAF